MGTPSLCDMCSPILPNDRSWAREPKQLLVKMLMPHHERLAAVFASVAADTPGTPLHLQRLGCRRRQPGLRSNGGAACCCASAAAASAVAGNGPAVAVAVAAFLAVAAATFLAVAAAAASAASANSASSSYCSCCASAAGNGPAVAVAAAASAASATSAAALPADCVRRKGAAGSAGHRPCPRTRPRKAGCSSLCRLLRLRQLYLRQLLFLLCRRCRRRLCRRRRKINK